MELSLKLRRAAFMLAATVTTLALAIPTYAQHPGGEANLVLPNLKDVTFLNGINGHNLLLFGIANQLLAAVALCVATTIIINSGRAKYAWVTIVPLAFVSTTTLVAGFKSITDIFWPLAQKPETSVQGLINTSLTVIIMVAAVIIMLDSIRRWVGTRSHPQLTPIQETAT